ncbi:putative PKS/NRPS-like protein biosynthetic cluster [Microsporum ferrugineum]
MVGTMSAPAMVPTIHLFGPQALAFREESFNNLKNALLSTPYNQWILDIIETLPGLWETASKELPIIQSLPGGHLLENLTIWIKEKTVPEATFPLPNILLTPLVVITHITQYLRYLEHIDPTCPGLNHLQSSIHTESETLGLCTGLLTAVTVSNSANAEQFRHNGAVAIRLAMLTGALVDAENESNSEGGTVSLSVTWNFLKSQVKMLEILKQFPQAYISVLYDEKRATITCSKFKAAKLASQLRTDGLIVAELNLHGCFHYQGHKDAVELLIKFCNSKPELQYTVRKEVGSPNQSYESDSVNNDAKLHQMALRSILVEQCDWYRTFAATYSSNSNSSQPQVVLFGYDNCVPPSVARNLGRKLINAMNLEEISSSMPRILPDPEVTSGYTRTTDDIAVVGMACKVAGADDIEQFWDILSAGKSQHTEPPSDRFHFGTFWRELDPKRRWYGNFITNPDTFDHRFFKKSPREMISTDPQQRWMLQIAYQALQQSGYFLSLDQDKHIGCYIGLGCVDYEHNIACYPANAFSATGNLRSFVAGKVSHHFGWTGPSLTIDSACSSSAVAIHHACRAILSGECSLSRALLFSCESTTEMEQILEIFDNSESETQSIEPLTTRPVVLCFGGQISTFIGLDREIYDTCKIFRRYLDQCNLIFQSLGLDDIFPEVFQREPVKDTVKLQTMLFATQYSCAMAWIDCGIKPVALVGHSFGELTALCVSGVLSLAGAAKMIAGRAGLIQDLWGPDKGFMMAIEADIQDVEYLLRESNRKNRSDQAVAIACYNGPRSFTIAGPAQATKAIEELMSNNSTFSSMKWKKLNVTNAYHSTLVEPLVESLGQIGQDLLFRKARIPIERCTEYPLSSDGFDSRFISQHMRCPVYFNHAVQRLSLKYPSSIWLEAGSNSTITAMAGRALGLPSGSHFQSINITSGKGLQSLIDATISLWKNGLNTTFWPHHSSQTPEYSQILLPPYQFDKTSHWVTLKKPEEAVQKFQNGIQFRDEPSLGLWKFAGYKGDDQQRAQFRINTASKEFDEYVSGHTIANAAPLCPSTLQLDIVIEALLQLRPEYLSSNLQPQLQGLENHVPICLDPTLCVWLDVQAIDSQSHCWEFKMISEPTKGNETATLHVSGKIIFKSNEDVQLQNDFARYERLSGHERCLSLLNGEDGDDMIQGRNIYKIFAEIVDYSQIYRGVQKLVGKGNESAGKVVKKYTGTSWLDTPLADSFCQCAGIFVNCMTEISDKEMYISTKIEQWIRSPNLLPNDPRPDVWHVLAFHRRPSEKEFISDVFIFDPRNGELLEIILGIGYKKVSKRSLGKMLSSLTPGKQKSEAKTVQSSANIEDRSKAIYFTESPPAEISSNKTPIKDVSEDIRILLANVSGLETHEIKNDTGLSDIGIDSLMGMELAREIETTFKCSLDTEVLNTITDFKSLMKCIQEALGCSEQEKTAPETGTNTDTIDINTDMNMDIIGVAHANNNYLQINGSLSEDEILNIPANTILEAFKESKQLTDEFIYKYKFANYADYVLPKQTELCIAYITEAFEKLGCSLRKAKMGDRLDRINYLPKHEKFVNYLYMMLEKEARLVDLNETTGIVRTAIQPPTKPSGVLLQELINDSPDHANDHKLTHLIGSKLAECLSGGCDGVQLIFGSPEGRELVTGLYGKSPINMVWLRQMEDLIRRIILKLPTNKGPLKILEMGAGTGGTTAILGPLLASLGVAVEYTFTDLSPSLVSAARKRFKRHSFMNFRVHDIEKAPAAELLHSQHIVIANNCVHATHNLVNSTRQIRQVLRPDGFLMILEMTDTLYWVDLVFGVLEGWWLYDDGRKHVVAHQSIWERSMQSAGYGHIDWTEGNRPEANIQRIIIALASGPRYDRLPKTPNHTESQATGCAARQAIVDNYVREYTRSFPATIQVTDPILPTDPGGHSVLVTGATGSLGSHLVAHFARLPEVREVVCLNRRNSVDALLRQVQSLEGKGILLDEKALSKLRILATQGDKENLGLQEAEYQYLARSVTHIIHGAWPMSIKRPVKGFEPQFQFMRNLINLAVEISSARAKATVGFQFISSIATVGYHPIETSEVRVPEERVTVKSVLPSGYGDAKLVCERMLEQTLHEHPDRFRPMSVRIGQIAGSKDIGYWNPVEHFSFLVKSSQVLRLFPDLRGELSWYPVDDVAATLSDLLLSENVPYPIYHIENPVRQPWSEMTRLLADALDIPRDAIIPFDTWMRRVRHFTGSTESNNPAKMLLDFFKDHFARMSCGGLILDTTNSREHSQTLANARPISPEFVAKYITRWKTSGFLC